MNGPTNISENQALKETEKKEEFQKQEEMKKKIEKIIIKENLHLDFSELENISSKKVIEIIKDKFLKEKIYELEKIFNIAVRKPHHYFRKETLVLKDFSANFIRFKQMGIEFENIAEIILSESPGQKDFQKSRFLDLIDLKKETVIVDLRHEEYDYKENNFAYEYSPREEGKSRVYENKIVKCEKIESFENISKNISIYHLNVLDKQKNFKRKFTRIHYPNWIDGGLIEAEEVEKLIEVIRKTSEKSLEKIRLVIHCNAGIGRSGRTAIALALKRQIENKKIEKSDEDLNEKVADIILKVVSDRIPCFMYVVYLGDHWFRLIDRFLSVNLKKINAPKEKVF
jgi:protein tyrosine phosphatase